MCNDHSVLRSCLLLPIARTSRIFNRFRRLLNGILLRESVSAIAPPCRYGYLCTTIYYQDFLAESDTHGQSKNAGFLYLALIIYTQVVKLMFRRRCSPDHIYTHVLVNIH